MEPRQENRNRDDKLDARIDHLVTGQHDARQVASAAEQVAQEFARLTSEESPRLSNAARARGLNTLRARAAQKRAQRLPNPFAFLFSVPRWVQVAAVAIVVVLIANGVTTAAADALPGTLLYPFKRFGEGGQLLLQNTNGQRARLWMNLAATRLDEVQGLLHSGGQVDPIALDAVDESILRALSELSGTRGEERVQLLQQLLALSVRQQQIVNQLAQNASPTDRTRYEQTAKLLQGIASYAQSPDAVLGVDGDPFQFLTPTPTDLATGTPTITSTPLPTQTATPLPTSTIAPPPTLLPTPESSNVIIAATQPAPTQPVNANDNGSNDNSGSGNSNDNGTDDNDKDGGNGNTNGGDDNGKDNDGDDHSNIGNGNDNSGNDNSGDDNGGGDNSGDDNSGPGVGNDNGGDDNSGSGVGNDNGGGDNSGPGGGNDNGGDDKDNGSNDNGDNDNRGDNNDNGGGDNNNDNGGGHGGGSDNGNDNGDSKR